VPICYLSNGLRSEPSRVEGTSGLPKSCGELQFFEVIRAFVHRCKRRGGTRHQHSSLVAGNPPVVAHFCSLRKPSADPELSRHPRSADSFRLPSLIILDKAVSHARRKPRYRPISQQANGLRDGEILSRRNSPRQRGRVPTRAARIRHCGMQSPITDPKSPMSQPGLLAFGATGATQPTKAIANAER
jgi:hypothetical protein